MKLTRLIIYFLIGMALGAVAVKASAETIPATPNSGGYVWRAYQPNTGTWYYSTQGAGAYADRFGHAPKAELCPKAMPGPPYMTWNGQTTPADNLCYQAGGNGYETLSLQSVGTYYTCPSGQNWTVSGSSCTRPDCVAPQTRNAATGVCEAPQTPCEMFPGSGSTPTAQPSNCTCPSGTQWVPMGGCRKKCDNVTTGADANAGFDLAIGKGQATGCFAGCEVQHKSGPFDILKDGSHSAPATYTGWACSGNGAGTAPTQDGQPQPDSEKLDPTKKHPPKCGAGEGVITSSSGAVLCLPAGTPNTSTPKVESSKKTETFPDNTTKTTETTKTTDPNTGATTTTTSETATGGQSGTEGTKTSTENNGGSDGNGDGDGDGACDPTLNFCGGPGTDGLYTKKEKTFQSVLTAFKDQIAGSAIGTATTGFFNVSTPGGSCPGWSVAVPFLNVTLNGAEIFCSGAILNAMTGAGYVLLALATFIAFTWAFL